VRMKIVMTEIHLMEMDAILAAIVNVVMAVWILVRSAMLVWVTLTLCKLVAEPLANSQFVVIQLQTLERSVMTEMTMNLDQTHADLIVLLHHVVTELLIINTVKFVTKVPETLITELMGAHLPVLPIFADNQST